MICLRNNASFHDDVRVEAQKFNEIIEFSWEHQPQSLRNTVGHAMPRWAAHTKANLKFALRIHALGKEK